MSFPRQKLSIIQNICKEIPYTEYKYYLHSKVHKSTKIMFYIIIYDIDLDNKMYCLAIRIQYFTKTNCQSSGWLSNDSYLTQKKLFPCSIISLFVVLYYLFRVLQTFSFGPIYFKHQRIQVNFHLYVKVALCAIFIAKFGLHLLYISKDCHK